jgi:DNA-binding NarL/FixJ family response regulator
VQSSEAALPRLSGLVIGLCGRHELYVLSLAALLSDRGAEVRVLDTPDDAVRQAAGEPVQVLLVESPLLSELAALPVRLPAVVLADHVRPGHVAEALALGVHAVLEKNTSLGTLVRALRSAIEDDGLPERGVSLTQRQIEDDGLPERGVSLTQRQGEVLRLIGEGLDNAQIATRLGITQRTARAHVSDVLERLGATNRTQAAVTALRKGYIE